MQTTAHAKILAFVLLFIIVTLPLANSLLAHSKPIEASGTIVYVRSLHTNGRYIKDDLGRIVRLRGVNKGGYNNIPYGRWQREGQWLYDGKTSFNEDAVHYQCEILRDAWGINLMSWTIDIHWWLNNSGDYRYNIKRAIEIAGQYGIYISLRPWSVVSADGQDWMPFPPYTAHPEIMTSQQDFVDFWISVANELGRLPNVIFDLYNEPVGENGFSEDMTARATWFNVSVRAIHAIREVTNNIVFVQWGYGVGRGAPLNWVDPFLAYLQEQNATENVVFTTHTYHDSWTFMHGGNNTLEALRQEYIDAGLYHMAMEIGIPALIGEFGRNNWMGDQMANETIWFSNSLQLFNEWGIGYAIWILFPEGVIAHGILQGNTLYFPPPNDAGQILIDAIASGS